ncbi:MAG: hypothetical protein ACYCX4_04730 [Bacillota bacterium]
MDEKIRQVYDMFFSPLVTPHNLLDNARLENYEFVTYSKMGTGLLVSMRCNIDLNITATFFYHFDVNDFLQTVVMESDNGQEIIFDRQKEAQTLVDRILKTRNEAVAKEAI